MVPVKDRQVWIRLTAKDIDSNTNNQVIWVEIPAVVQTRKGRTISTQNQKVALYFPPNTLAQDTIATVNVFTEVEVELPAAEFTRPMTSLRLNSD